MSREIKFRIYNKNTKRVEEVKELSFFVNDFVVRSRCIETRKMQELVNNSECVLLQYTGLKDKNGVEIYEGDIVRGYFKHYKNKTKAHSFKGIVEFNEDRFDLKFIVGKHTNVLTNTMCYDTEVIGNIYENKELLAVN